ncbi:MAG: oxygen-dependent coproporphyrinogen oxidase [Oscillochloridaceae bacterium]|nr:oxygen-dependent coproporphyrinogen oxidase [Chloroflexaceae bacterium]MDW8391328.1 oxygen-dependent coproporphyrinogen oxidase [Oscillochloridaceae bacterium]
MTLTDTREQVHGIMREAQAALIAGFEEVEREGATCTGLPPGRFDGVTWERPGGGGGTARVLTEGAVFERAGVNVSAVYGDEAPPSIYQEKPGTRGLPFFATGVSMVLHPRNPYAPAFHANFRYFEAGMERWFGGGMDLTPSYGFEEDARHFHVTLKAYVERHGVVDYPTVKDWCDRYFYLPHRHEMRGIGGIFFDDLSLPDEESFERTLAFVRDGAATILAAYLPLVRRRLATPYGERERRWQLYRRGRYVEFNLALDRGTRFGLQTEGDIEAILMSLPPLARWEFRYMPPPGSPEAEMARFLVPRDWAG